MDLKIIRMNKVETVGKVAAFVDIDFYGLTISGLKIIKGEKGSFVAYPQVKGKDGNYHSTVFPKDVVLKSEIEKYIISSFENLRS